MKKLCMFYFRYAGCFLRGRKFRAARKFWGPEVPGKFRGKFRVNQRVCIDLVQREPGSSRTPGSSGAQKFRANFGPSSGLTRKFAHMCLIGGPEVPGCVSLCVTGRFGGALYKAPFFPILLEFLDLTFPHSFELYPHPPSLKTPIHLGENYPMDLGFIC